MRSVGVICEYNPFHAGHAHLLREAPEGVRVCLMSGNFVQRGEAAILPAHTRAEMALCGGADLVLELPFPYAAGSARYFATAGVRALAALGCGVLAFGSESADAEALYAAAKHLDSAEFAADFAARDAKTGDAAAHFSALGSTPASNDILALEYVRAILAQGETMQIAPVLRVGAAYREEVLGEGAPSATALRACLAAGEDVAPHLPPCVRGVFAEALAAQGGAADTARLATALLARLRVSPPGEEVAECGGGLGAHLAKAAAQATDYASLLEAAATKRYTNGRIRRALLYTLAGVRHEDLNAPPAYLRLLGANERGREYLAESRKTRRIQVITKISELDQRDAAVQRQLALSLAADALYALCLPQPTQPHALSTKAPVML